MGHLGPFTLVLVLEGVLSRRCSYGLPLLLHNGMSVHPSPVRDSNNTSRHTGIAHFSMRFVGRGTRRRHGPPGPLCPPNKLKLYELDVKRFARARGDDAALSCPVYEQHNINGKTTRDCLVDSGEASSPLDCPF